MHKLFKKSAALLTGIEQTKWVYSDDDQVRIYKTKFPDPPGQGLVI